MIPENECESLNSSVAYRMQLHRQRIVSISVEIDR